MSRKLFNGIAGTARWKKRLFLACGRGGLKVFEEADGDGFECIAELTGYHAFDVLICGDLIAVAASQKGVIFLDPKTLRPVHAFPLPFPVHSLRLRQGHLVAQACLPEKGDLHALIPLPPEGEKETPEGDEKD